MAGFPNWSPTQMAAAMMLAGWPDDQIPVGVAVGLAESGGNPNLQPRNPNGSTDSGLWQINSVHGFPELTALIASGDERGEVLYQWQDGITNAGMAFKVFQRRNSTWQPWVQYTNGKYKLFLPRGQNGFAEAKAIRDNPNWTLNGVKPTDGKTRLLLLLKDHSVAGAIAGEFAGLTSGLAGVVSKAGTGIGTVIDATGSNLPGALGSAFDTVTGGLAKLFTGAFWVRIGSIVGGAILILIVLIIVMKQQSAPRLRIAK